MANGKRQNGLMSGRMIQAATLALFCVCGTTASMAQVNSKNPMGFPTGSQPPAASSQPAGKSQPGGVTQGQPGGIRNPLDSGQDLTGKVKVDENSIVDLHVNEESLTNVLQMLSIQSQRNIITSKNVSATVTANLYGVTFYEALDAILHVNGFGYLERGNFIYVYTLEELQKIEEAQRQRVSKVVNLNYLSATDGAEFVKALLSEGGQIKTNGKTENFPSLGDTPVNNNQFAAFETLVIYDYEENVAEIEKLLKELDAKPVQVLVEATILQSQVNENNAFGVDFSIIADLNFGDFVNIGGPLKTVDGLIGGTGTASSGTGGSGSGSGGAPLPGDGRGASLGSTAGNTSGPATFKAGIVWNDVAAFIRLLDEVSDTTILSRPNLLILNRQPGRVLVGRKVGYLNTTSTSTATTQTVEFLDTGTQLHIRPFVSSDGNIRMELRPQVSEAVIRTITDAGGAAVTIPDEVTNEMTTNVSVRDGQTVVLGGLFRESTSASRRQVPGLGDLPIIGAAFRGHEDEVQRNEIIFMITPTIIADATLAEQAGRAKGYVERVRTGSREGLLPWSREKRTGQMLVEAETQARNGKIEDALSTVQRALALNHFQPDAIALREKLMNEKAVWPNRNTLDEIVHGEMQARMDAMKVSSAPSSPSPVNSSLSGLGSGAQANVSETPEISEPLPSSNDPWNDPNWSEPDPFPMTPPSASPESEPSWEPAEEPTEPPIAWGVPGNPFGLKVEQVDGTAPFGMAQVSRILRGFAGPVRVSYRTASAGSN
jgi:type IV pilus assembly protein PilQ